MDKVQTLIQLFRKMDIDEVCGVISCADLACNNCPFNSSQELLDTADKLEALTNG